MFPPPTTAATWTPSSTTATISLAMRSTTRAEMPSGSSPENASLDSLTTTRRHGQCTRSAAAAVSAAASVSPLSAAWPLLADPAPSFTAEPVTRAAPSPLWALFSTMRPPPLSVRERSSACLADLEARERPYPGALLAEHLLDRLLGILDERLLYERHVLKERAQPALDDPGDRLLGLALVAGDLLRDAALVLDNVGRYLVAGHILRPHRRDLLGDVLARLLVRRVKLDQHLQRQHGKPVGGALHQRRGGDVRRHPLEQVGLRDEVGLAVQLDQDPGARAVERRRDEPVGRRPRGPPGHILDALEAQQFDRLLEIATRLRQRVLAIQYPCAGGVAKPLHICAGEVRHVLISHCLI